MEEFGWFCAGILIVFAAVFIGLGLAGGVMYLFGA